MKAKIQKYKYTILLVAILAVVTAIYFGRSNVEQECEDLGGVFLQKEAMCVTGIDVIPVH